MHTHTHVLHAPLRESLKLAPEASPAGEFGPGIYIRRFLQRFLGNSETWLSNLLTFPTFPTFPTLPTFLTFSSSVF